EHQGSDGAEPQLCPQRGPEHGGQVHLLEPQQVRVEDRQEREQAEAEQQDDREDQWPPTSLRCPSRVRNGAQLANPSKAVRASSKVETGMIFIEPVSTPRSSFTLSFGPTKTVAPAFRAPITLRSIPPIGYTVPSG